MNVHADLGQGLRRLALWNGLFFWQPEPEPWPEPTAPAPARAYEFGTGRPVALALLPRTVIGRYGWASY